MNLLDEMLQGISIHNWNSYISHQKVNENELMEYLILLVTTRYPGNYEVNLNYYIKISISLYKPNIDIKK